MKKIIIAFIFIFSLSFFYGCTSKTEELEHDFVSVQMQYLPNGNISQSFAIKTNFVSQLSDEECVTFSQGVCKALDEKRNRFFLAFAVTYLQNPNEEFKIGKGVIVSPVCYQTDKQIFSFQISFPSIAAWQYYNHSQRQEGEIVRKVPFFEKKTSKSTFPLANKGENECLGESFANVIISQLGQLEKGDELIKQYKPNYIYCYSTYISKIKSNADFVNRKGGQNYHIWIEKELQNCGQIEIYYYLYDRGLWLVLAVVIPTAGLSLYLLHLKLLKKKKGH